MPIVSTVTTKRQCEGAIRTRSLRTEAKRPPRADHGRGAGTGENGIARASAPYAKRARKTAQRVHAQRHAQAWRVRPLHMCVRPRSTTLPHPLAATKNAIAILHKFGLRLHTPWHMYMWCMTGRLQKSAPGTAPSFMLRRPPWQHPSARQQELVQLRPPRQAVPRAPPHPRPDARQRSGSMQQPCQTGGAPRG